MTIYGDITFFINFFFDYFSLWLTSVILKVQITRWRIILASLIGTIYALIYLLPFPFLKYFLFKIFVSILMLLITFSIQPLNKLIKIIVYFYIINFILGGGTLALQYFVNQHFLTLKKGSLAITYVSPLYLITLGGGFILTIVLTKKFWHLLRFDKEIEKHLYVTTIVIDGHEIILNGLVDTGNSLKDPITGIPVIVVSIDNLSFLPTAIKKIVENDNLLNHDLFLSLPMNWYKRLKIIPYRTIGMDSNWILALKPDLITIKMEKGEKKIKRVLIGIKKNKLATDNLYQVILHPEILIS